ncbi:MAG: Gfo/Idh/MocA family oxidoreductase [Gemmatimonadaceae bacterium]|nr:Gfo/Idh/MocA family oxidoreductase [Gemmatimonadaceae bacterium]
MSRSSRPPESLSRREFVQQAAIASAVIAAPLILPSRLFGARAPSNRVRVGHIGAGRIAQSHDMPGVVSSDLADSVAVCDLDSRRAASAKRRLERLLAGRTAPNPTIDLYGNYRELLARRDIDAVTISTPDHWHAELALAAMYAGKDVYLQKPFTMTHAEGVVLRDAVARTGRILQVGSQQRSWPPGEQFRKAAELVRSGRVGQLRRVEIGLPTDPTAPDQPAQPVPPNLDYERWLGPTPEVYYTEQRVHPQGLDKEGEPDVSSRPGWLRNDAYCLGMITGWGAHHFDVAHWGMNTELSGPSRIEGTGVFPTNKIWNVHGAYRVELTYPGNIILTVADTFPNGVRFIGDDGWIFVSRDGGGATASDPTGKATRLKSLDASDPRLLDPAGVTVEFPHSTSHHRNWLESVVSRQQPLSPAPIAHRANTACILSWIAMKLGRPLAWDATAERFVNDAVANSMLTRPERAPYGALRLAASHGGH